MFHRSTIMRTAYLVLLCAVLVGVLFCASHVVHGKIMVCPKCGYELAENADVCGHCGARVPRPSVEPAPKASSTDTNLWIEGEPGFLSAEVVRAEIAAGQERLDKGAPEVARLFFKNALALNLLAEPEPGKELGEKIVALMRKCTAGGGGVRVKCDMCGGTGKGTMKVVSLKGEVSYVETPGRPCSECGGTGYTTRMVSLQEKKYRTGRALSNYATLQKGRRFVQLGGAWAPAEIEKHLSLRQIVSLRRSAALPCSACMGTGLGECPECKGEGRAPCPNPKCQNGMVKEQVGGMLSTKSKLTRNVRCPVCNGKGHVACVKCQGAGSVVCEECGGTGERPLCDRCGGQGLVNCTRCQGAGTIKNAPCPACGGAGVVVCKTCNGDGRKK